MRMQSNEASRLAQLADLMAKASAAAAQARADLKRAERRVDRADDAYSELREAYDHERLKLWGSSPDVAELLASDGSSAFYDAGKALAESMGLGFGMKWADVNQTVLHVRLNRGQSGEVERAEAAVRYFAPFVKSKAGVKRFSVQHHEGGDFAVELRFSVKTGAAKVARSHFGMDREVLSFKTLTEALRHIEQHHWLEDIIEMPEGQTLLT